VGWERSHKPTDRNPPEGLPTPRIHIRTFIVWQRSDSAETFYSCSDVVNVDGGDTATSLPCQVG
jgi:hypothetical protein